MFGRKKQNVLTTDEIKKLYKFFREQNYKAVYNMIKDRPLFVITENDKVFKNSVQAQGMQLFTDYNRAAKFLAQEENATIHCRIETIPFSDAWQLAPGDFFINMTPYGDPALFVRFSFADDRWYLCTKDAEANGLTAARNW